MITGNYKYTEDSFLKDVVYNKNKRELRQINLLSGPSLTSAYLYSVTSSEQDWTSNYYGLTSFPYSVISLKELYDNVIKGFTNLNINSSISGNVIFDDEYLLNSNNINRFGILLENSTSVTSSVTSSNYIGHNFIDYQNGLMFVTDGNISLNAVNYSSAVQIYEHEFLCLAKINEFNKTVNPSAYQSITGYISEFENTYITGLGIYDDDYNLLMVAKLESPIKKSKKIDMLFKLQMDM